MGKTYYCISDIHSGFTPMKKALWQAGYRKTDKNAVLVIAGDLFDRLNESAEVYNFVHSIPKNRRILVRGNHEDLMMDLLSKFMPDSHDYSNGTVRTICNFTGHTEEEIRWGTHEKESYIVWEEAKQAFKKMGVYKFIKNKSNWVNYAEIGKYIIVHSFIPTKLKPEYSFLKYQPRYNVSAEALRYDPDWRKADLYDWEDARWGNPAEQFKSGLFDEELKQGKTLICGHWHTADFWNILDGEYKDITECNLYNNHGIIGLDACTVRNKRCNVFKIEME